MAFQLMDHFSYECDQPNDDLSCPICKSVLQQPVTCISCRHMFCGACIKNVERDRCPMCRKDRAQYTEPPIYVTDHLRTLPNVACTICLAVVPSSKAQAHHLYECPRLVHAVHPPPPNAADGECCLGSLQAPWELRQFVSNHGRIYTADSEGLPHAVLSGQPMAPGLQWILQQTLKRSGGVSVTLPALVSSLADAESYRSADFGLRNERALHNRAVVLEEQLKDANEQRSQMQREMICAEQRAAGLLLDLSDAQDQIAQLQQMHSGSDSSSRKRRRAPRSEFDGQPSPTS